ncbi:MAG: peptide ABC transporter substrate-binding protein [Anaerolineae bacterium]|nr:peptide ABC transporter substrate-binding protein [Anaerolineae bacterium]
MIVQKKLMYLFLLLAFLGLGCQFTRLTPTQTPAILPSPTPTHTPEPLKPETATPISVPTPTPVPDQPTATPGPKATPKPIDVSQENILRLWSQDPETLDPAITQDSTSHQFVSLLFSGLVKLDANLNVVGDLAERWEIDATGTVYTFYLHKNAKFHNGRQVTAQDVLYSFERACNPKRGSVQRAQSYLNDIVGVMARTMGESGSIEGLKAVDDFTVQITIDAPKPYFLAKLTYPTSYIVCKENVEDAKRNWLASPIGSGPFMVEKNAANEMVLAAFDEYYLGRPKLDKVVFEYRGSTMNMYERGELDVIEVGAANIDRVLDPNDPLHQDLRIVSQLDVWYIGFNASLPPFDDVHVRRAFAYATNKQAIADIVFNKTVIPANGILPPGMPGYNPDLEGIPFDPDMALEEMVESDYGDASELPPITLTVTGAEFGETLAAMYLQVLGVEVEVEVVDWGVFLSGLDTQKYQMYSLGWIADYPDPQNFLDLLFHSTSAYNHGAYSNLELDALVEEARVEQDYDARMALYQQAEELLVNDVPWIPIYHSGGYYLVKSYVKGLVITGQDTMNLADVSLEE